MDKQRKNYLIIYSILFVLFLAFYIYLKLVNVNELSLEKIIIIILILFALISFQIVVFFSFYKKGFFNARPSNWEHMKTRERTMSYIVVMLVVIGIAYLGIAFIYKNILPAINL